MKLSWSDTTIIKPHVSDAGRNFYDNVMGVKTGKLFLETKVRATHSGHLITGRCYTGWGMRSGTPTWFDMARGGKAGFDKPVIVDHDMATPPLGRVVFAEFTQLKTGDAWLSDWKAPETGPGKMGSGYVTTTSHIFDQDCMTMIMDGRYSTVSTRQVADDAWCNVCGTQFADGCEHEIGKVYDSVLCYAVCGLLDYVEMSFVNSPRQPNAKVMSFKEMRDALVEKDAKGVVYVGDCKYEAVVDSWTALRSQNDYDITINLADSNMPSIGTITGRTQISMSTVAEPKKVILAGFDEARQAAGEVVATKPQDAAASTEEVKATPEVKKELDFEFANLARLWKDHLDLKEPMIDGAYIMGITDKSSGHAHVLEGFLDTKNKVFRGNTFGAGQGKVDQSHSHSVWVENMDLNEGAVKGETRSATAGTDHIHTFSATMSDAAELRGTLISGIDAINEAINVLEERVNKDTLDSSNKEKLLGGEKTKITWDTAHFKAALRLMGRLSQSKRHEVLADMYASGLMTKDEEETEMEKSTVDKLVSDLLADKTKLTAQLADAVQLADSKEAERQKLLDENVGLKTAVLNLKATLVVDAREKLSGTKLEDAARKAAITDLATKDEAALDALVNAELLGNVRKEVVAAVVPVVETKQKSVVAGATLTAVEDTSSKPGTESPVLSKKNLASLDSRVSKTR